MTKYRIEAPTRDNVGSVPELIYSVYGYTYEPPELYEPEGMLRIVERGDAEYFLAVDEGNRVQAMLGLSYPFPGRSLGFLVSLMTAPQLRGIETGLVFRDLAQAVRARAIHLAETGELRALISSEVTVHHLTQRMVAQIGFVPTGIFLNWCPAWSERQRSFQQRSSAQRSGRASPSHTYERRRAESVSAYPFRSFIEPYDVFLPSRFASILEKVYAALNLPVRFSAPKEILDDSLVETRVDYLRSHGTVDIRRGGRGAAEQALAAFEHLKNGMLDLIHVIVPLEGGSCEETVEALCGRGCRYGALLPRYPLPEGGSSDVLVLQYLGSTDSDLKEEQLAFPLLREIFECL